MQILGTPTQAVTAPIGWWPHEAINPWYQLGAQQAEVAESSKLLDIEKLAINYSV